MGTGDLTPGGGFPIDYSVYDKFMFACTVNDLPAATLSMTLGLMSAIWFARPITRFVMRLLLPPATRWHIAWLWTAVHSQAMCHRVAGGSSSRITNRVMGRANQIADIKPRVMLSVAAGKSLTVHANMNLSYTE